MAKIKNASLRFSKPDFESLISKEWIVTNGLGGYASSTLSGAHSRRYHGLLVAALNPPTQRTVIVSNVEETLVDGKGERFPLAAHEFPGVVSPEGYQYLREFIRNPIPAFRYEAQGMRLKKSIFMPYGSNATVIEYENQGKIPFKLDLRPFFVYRDYHSLMHQNASFNFWTEWKSPNSGVMYAQYGAPPLFFTFSKGVFTEQRLWYNHFIYRKETYRGLDDREDCYTPGVIQMELQPGEHAYLVFSIKETITAQDPTRLKAMELDRVQRIQDDPCIDEMAGVVRNLNPKEADDVRQIMADLFLSADQFIVQRKSSGGHTLIAGYHWFTDWGRDTMIAMRGLVIAQGKKELAQSILLTFLQYLDQGMLPNRFPDQGEAPEYNTIDATLWLFVVLHEYAEKFGDMEFIRQVFPSLTRIIESHIHGTRYDIHMTEEGLLFGGKGIVQLTWMDAKVGDHVVTPRHGCPVEINALWYNALMIYHSLGKKIKAGKSPYIALAKKVKESFVRYFWNGRYLNDVVIPDSYVDDAIRPNQLYALSLPFAVVDKKMGEAILKVVKDKLVTPLGIRSLDPAHDDFVPVYGGDQWHRDHAYHQGTVWTFLIGEYWLAYLHQNNFSAAAKREVWKMMQPLLDHFYTADGIHAMSEIFDGLKPGAGRGCIQQAWSIGMVLKVMSALGHEAQKAK